MGVECTVVDSGRAVYPTDRRGEGPDMGLTEPIRDRRGFDLGRHGFSLGCNLLFPSTPRASGRSSTPLSNPGTLRVVDDTGLTRGLSVLPLTSPSR